MFNCLEKASSHAFPSNYVLLCTLLGVAKSGICRRICGRLAVAGGEKDKISAVTRTKSARQSYQHALPGNASENASLYPGYSVGSLGGTGVVGGKLQVDSVSGPMTVRVLKKFFYQRSLTSFHHCNIELERYCRARLQGGLALSHASPEYCKRQLS